MWGLGKEKENGKSYLLWLVRFDWKVLFYFFLVSLIDFVLFGIMKIVGFEMYIDYVF